MIGALRYVRDWIFTVPLLLFIGVAMLTADVVGRIASLFGARPLEVVIGIQTWLIVRAFAICGVFVKVERSPLIRPRTGYVIVSNHQSNFDIPLLIAELFTNYPKFVGKSSLARFIPSVSFPLRKVNTPIDQSKPREALRAIRDLGRRAQERNVAAIIFPEGTRARDGVLRAFSPAGTATLIDAAADLPVIPATIDGADRLMVHGLFPVPFGTKVRLRLGDPIDRSSGATAEELLVQAREEIESTLTRWRS